jgi:uncharacterized protein (TIGR02246 family)
MTFRLKPELRTAVQVPPPTNELKSYGSRLCRRIQTMQSREIQSSFRNAADDEQAIRSIHYRMIEAWNAGDASAFIAPFRDDADFIAFEGTHLKGREQMLAFHQRIFDTVVKGSRMEGEVKFVRFLNPVVAVMHSAVTYALRDQARASRTRDSMQLTVVTKRDGEWRGEVLMNARRVTMEDQDFVDGIDLLPAEAQREVRDLVASLKKRHR